MKNVVICGLVLALGLVLGLEATARIGRPADPKLAHMVFFWLKDHSKESRDKFIASCEKLLSHHEGAGYFSVGTRAADVDEAVSVKDFDVALHVVFASKEGKLKYLKSPRHDQFVKDNGAQFEKVQVFDSYLMPEVLIQTRRESRAIDPAGVSGGELATSEVARRGDDRAE